MSSLSQEDLDAGWAEPDSEQAALPGSDAAGAVPHASTPPNSITIETTPAPLESLIMHSPPPPDASDESHVKLSAAALLSAQEFSETESVAENQPAQDSAASAPETVDNAVAETTPPAESEAPTSEHSVRSADSVAIEEPLSPSNTVNESNAQTTASEESPAPPRTVDESASQAIASEESPALSGAVDESNAQASASGELAAASSIVDGSDSRAIASDDSAESIGSDIAVAVTSDKPEANLEPFVTVTEKPQSPSERGIESTVEPEDAANGTIAEQATVQESPTPELASFVGHSVDSAADLPIPQAPRVTSRATNELASDEPLAVEVVASAPTESYVIQHWRMIAIAAVATVALVVGLLAIRSKQRSRAPEQSAAVTRVAPIQPGPALPIAVGAPESARPTSSTGASSQAESFSDSFAKHAATVNSSWAQVKKRPRAVESNQSVKPTAAASAKTEDNPLDVLDKLERARKAKKSGGK